MFQNLPTNYLHIVPLPASLNSRMESSISAQVLTREYEFDVQRRRTLPIKGDDGDFPVLSSTLRQDDSTITKWKELFDPTVGPDRSLTAAFEIEAKRLRQDLDAFQAKLPEDDRIEFDRLDPSMEALADMVRKTAHAYETRRQKGSRGKFMHYFHGFCSTLDAHSNLFALFPQGSEYTSIFSGSLMAIIKASVNHEAIANGLAQALDAISKDIVSCKADFELFKTEPMQQAVADLYAHIFLFFRDVMAWYTKRKMKGLLGSFNEKLQDHFQDSINNIRDKSEIIWRESMRGNSAEGRVTRLRVEETQIDVRVGFQKMQTLQQRMFADQLLSQERQEREFQRRMAIEAEKIRRDVKNDIEGLKHTIAQGFLINREIDWRGDGVSPPRPTHRMAVSLQTDLVRTGSGSGTDKYFRDQVCTDSRQLERLFRRDRVRLHCDSNQPLRIDPRAISRLGEWTQESEQAFLYIAGRTSNTDGTEHPMTWLAAKFIGFADNSGAGVISYFCDLEMGDDLETAREMQATVELLSALIRQAAELLPPTLESTVDLSAERFAQLGDSATSWEAGIGILRDLLALLPNTVNFCVIDGIQWLDDETTDDALGQLVEELRQSRMKVLFTTVGRSRALLGNMDGQDMVLLDQQMGRGKVVRGFI